MEGFASEGVMVDTGGVHGRGFDVGLQEAGDAEGVRSGLWVAEKTARLSVLGNASEEAANVGVLSDVELAGEKETPASPEADPAAGDAAKVGADVDAAFRAGPAGASFAVGSHGPCELARCTTDG